MIRLVFVLVLLVAVLSAAGCTRGHCCPPVGPAAIPIPIPQPGEGRTQVLVEMTCARIDVEALPNVLGIPPGDGKTLVAVETERGAKALLERWRTHPAVTLEVAPSVVATEGDVASITVGETVGGTAHLAWPPHDDTTELLIGTHIVLIVECKPSGSFEVHLKGVWRRLDPTLEPLQSNPEAFARAVAESPVAQADATFEMPDGGYVVVAAPRVRQSDGTFRMYTLLHAVKLKPAEADDMLIEVGPRIDGPDDVPGRK